MINVRKSQDRGATNLGWLDSKHTFSFGEYYDPHNMGFRTLRVINDDRVAGRRGFGAHPHKDMEIITYVLNGSLKHTDSMGNSGIIQPGDVQRMSAGTGVIHSEVNPSDEPVHFFQIWIEPEKRGMQPSYEQRSFSKSNGDHSSQLLASRDGRNGSVTIHQDAEIWRIELDSGESFEHKLAPGKAALLQVVTGSVNVNGRALDAGDIATIENEPALNLQANSPMEGLLFRL